ncbi:unnamed protein product [Arabidopsis halleri]
MFQQRINWPTHSLNRYLDHVSKSLTTRLESRNCLYLEGVCKGEK